MEALYAGLPVSRPEIFAEARASHRQFPQDHLPEHVRRLRGKTGPASAGSAAGCAGSAGRREAVRADGRAVSRPMPLFPAGRASGAAGDAAGNAAKRGAPLPRDRHAAPAPSACARRAARAGVGAGRRAAGGKRTRAGLSARHSDRHAAGGAERGGNFTALSEQSEKRRPLDGEAGADLAAVRRRDGKRPERVPHGAAFFQSSLRVGASAGTRVRRTAPAAHRADALRRSGQRDRLRPPSGAGDR